VPEIGIHVPRAWLAGHYPLGDLHKLEGPTIDGYRARNAERWR